MGGAQLSSVCLHRTVALLRLSALSPPHQLRMGAMGDMLRCSFSFSLHQEEQNN